MIYFIDYLYSITLTDLSVHSWMDSFTLCEPPGFLSGLILRMGSYSIKMLTKMMLGEKYELSV